MMGKLFPVEKEWAKELIEKNPDPYIDAALRAPNNVSGVKLDNLAKVYKCYRLKNESDEKFRARLLTVMKEKLGR